MEHDETEQELNAGCLEGAQIYIKTHTHELSLKGGGCTRHLPAVRNRNKLIDLGKIDVWGESRTLPSDKGFILQTDIMASNIYVPNNRTPNYTRWKLMDLQKEIDRCTIRVRDFHTALSVIDKTLRQETGEGINDPGSVIHQLDLRDTPQQPPPQQYSGLHPGSHRMHTD